MPASNHLSLVASTAVIASPTQRQASSVWPSSLYALAKYNKAKGVVAPEEAETVRLIFRRYLELGAMGALMEELDRQGIRTKANRLADGRVRGGIRFGVGALAHLLKNRFYLGEVVYRGGVHPGE